MAQELSGPAVQSVDFSSSWLVSGSRDFITGVTHITFKSGYVWTGRMNVELWASLVAAGSPGRWWHANMM